MPEAERILQGREEIYLSAFYQRVGRDFKMPKSSVDEYIRTYKSPTALATALGWYRAFPEDEVANSQDKKNLMQIPMLVIANDWAGKDMPIIAEKLSQKQESVASFIRRAVFYKNIAWQVLP